MKIHLPANAIILPIHRIGVIHYFFLDTGFPSSFTKDHKRISSINQHDVGCEQAFNLPLSPAPIDIQPLSEHLMIDLAGFLGLDFLQQFDNVVVNFAERELHFNVDNFAADAVIPLQHTQPLVIELAVGNSGQFKSCLVDTGCYQSLFFDEQTGYYPQSPGWRFPSAFGTMEVDFYAGVDVKARNIDLGQHTFGKPSNLPPISFDYVLGLNILSQYECCFNLKQNDLQLRHNPRSCMPSADLQEHLYGLGMQLIRRNGALLVDNILPGFNYPSVALGDRIDLPGHVFKSPERLNQVCAHLMSVEESKQIEVMVNGVLASLKTKPMFL